jgi:hypothetical protein
VIGLNTSQLHLVAGAGPRVITGLQGSADPGILAAVHFTVTAGPTVTIIGQKNVASVVRNATGEYRITYTSALANTNYGMILGGRLADSTSELVPLVAPARNSTSGRNTYSTTTVDILVSLTNATAGVDPFIVSAIIFDPSAVSSNYLAGATVTLAGAVPTLQLQKNVASVAFDATGVYRATYTSTLGNSDYSVFGSSRYPDFTTDSSPFFGRNRNSSGSIDQQTTALIDLANGRLNVTTAGQVFDPGRYGFLLRNSDTAPRGTMAAVRFSVSGGVCTIIRQWNVSSVTYQVAGCYRVNFTTPLVDTDYGVVASGKWADTTVNDAPCIAMNRNTTNSRGNRTINNVDIASFSWGAGTPVFDSEIVDVWVVKPWLM